MTGTRPVNAVLDEHVAALAAVLRGPARVRARMLGEVRDGLADASQALVDAGWADEEAVRQAVREFGTVEEVAAAFQRELTIAQVRRTARTVALTVPLLLGAWILVGAHLEGLVRGLVVGTGALGLVAAVSAVLALPVTGGLGRRLAVPARLPLLVAWAGTTAGVAVAATALVVGVASVPGGDWGPALGGAVALVLHGRIAGAARDCRRCARLAAG